MLEDHGRLIYAVGVHRDRDAEGKPLRFSWPSNAELVADLARLGYLQPHWHILDPTNGHDVWWKAWKPDPGVGGHLTRHDLEYDGVDFRCLPYPDDHFDAITYDPEYAPAGSEETSSLVSIQERYGRTNGATRKKSVTPRQCQHTMHVGFTECVRVLAPGGIICTKSQNYVWNGDLWEGTQLLWQHGRHLGLKALERFEHVTDPKPQPLLGTCVHCGAKIQRRADGGWAGRKRVPRDASDEVRDANEAANRLCPAGITHAPDPTAPRQDHARTNNSTLYVWQKPRPKVEVADAQGQLFVPES